MRLQRSVVLLAMILGVGLSFPCHGADQTVRWVAAHAASSGVAAAEHANELRGYADDKGGNRWDLVAGYLVGQLELIGVEDLRREDLALAAGEHFPGRPLSTWHPISGVIADAASQAELVSLETSPGCVAIPSSSVRLEAEVVDVGTGIGPDAYLLKDVASKFVLASGELSEVYREAVLEREAAGVISYFEDELERGILDPEQLPRQSFVDDRLDRALPGTFAVTVMQGTALDLRRTLLRGQQVRLAIDIETDLREADVQAVSARLLPSADATEARDAQPLLLFADLGVGADFVSVGGAAALLEVARSLVALTDSGSFELTRPVVFLWSSDPASVRSFLATHDVAPVAAFELRDVGASYGLTSVLHLVTPPDSHASWLSDWAGLALDRALRQEIDEAPRWIVQKHVYDPECDRFLLNREGLAFPTLLLSESSPCGTHLVPTADEGRSFDEANMEAVVAATLDVIRPMVGGELPSDAALNRMGERLLNRHWQQALSAFEAIDNLREQGGSQEEAELQGFEVLDAARSQTETQLESWRGSLSDEKLDEMIEWLAAIDGLVRARIQETVAAADSMTQPPRIASVAVGSRPATSSPSLSPSRVTPAPVRTTELKATPPVRTVTPLPAPIATRTLAPRQPTPRPTAPSPLPPTPIPPKPKPTLTPVSPTPVPSTPTPVRTGPVTDEATANLANGKRLYEAGRCEEALAELNRIGEQTAEQFAQAGVLITVIGKRVEMSRAAFNEGLTHLTERRNDQAVTAFQRVVPCTAAEYRQAQERIRSIQDSAASREISDGECESLGVLRATRAQGDGRTVAGSLKIGEKAVYCFGAEMPGYGDLEVLVPMGFRAEGAGLVVAQGFKTFSGSDTRYVRYYAEKLSPETRVEVTLLNKQSTTAEFECEFYLYPR